MILIQFSKKLVQELILKFIEESKKVQKDKLQLK
jgi:hypothetical protein